MLDYKIRFCKEEDIGGLLRLVKGLAESQDALAKVTATEDGLLNCLFGDRPSAEAIVAETKDELFGFAVFFNTNSTYKAKPCLFLEDLYVQPEYRGKGAGKALFLRVASIANERNCARLDWLVLDWNASAIDFYRSLGATARDDVRPYRLEEHAIDLLLSKTTPV